MEGGVPSPPGAGVAEPRLKPLTGNERIAVAIPTKNRPSYLAALLASLTCQTFEDWALVINDSSDSPVEKHATIHDLLTLIRARGYAAQIIRTESGWDRHQRAMDAVPPDIELILRVDDDVMLTPRFLEDVQKPFRIFADRPVAAVGGCTPEAHLPALDLDLQLTDENWAPTIDEPSWRLQGHHYTAREVLEVESLLGHAICYRRSALTAVGGWAVEGYSHHAFREETDACMRLRAAGYELLVTTEALAWHLYAPGGGSRTIEKTAAGVQLTSDHAELQLDEALFRKRLAALKRNGLSDRALQRYRLADLAAGKRHARPKIGAAGRAKRLARQSRRALGRLLRRLGLRR
jgi:GT2 family glycosyltransferase